MAACVQTLDMSCRWCGEVRADNQDVVDYVVLQQAFAGLSAMRLVAIGWDTPTGVCSDRGQVALPGAQLSEHVVREVAKSPN